MSPVSPVPPWDATAKWRKGDDITNEPILNTEGKVWSPPNVNEFHFIDEFLDVIGHFYRISPDLLPAFMGAVMESFLTINAPPVRNTPSLVGEKSRMRKYTELYILPLIKMIDGLGEEEQQRFFNALELNLGGRDSATSDELLRMWSLMHSKDQYGTHFGRQGRQAAPGPSQKRTGTEQRFSKAGRTKRKTPPGSAS